MKPQIVLFSTLCSFLLTFPVFAAQSTSPVVNDENNPNREMDFPDEAYPGPGEEEPELPWNKYIGYDNGFFIRNPQNTFSLVFNGMTQARYVFSHSSDAISNDNDNTIYQRFELRRTDLYFTGHFIDESWRYVLGTEAGADGVFAVDDVYIAKDFNENLWGQVGQFSTPFLRETLISSTRQLTTERSLVSKYFSTNNSTGLLFGARNEKLKWEAAATNGYFEHDRYEDDEEDPDNHDFNSGQSYSFISRLEFKPLGEWQEFRGFNSFGSNGRGLLIGLAGAYQHDDDNADIEEASGTVDVTYQGSGWSIFSMGAVTQDLKNDQESSYGAQLQSGLFVDEERDTVELFSRYEWGDSGTHKDFPDSDSADLSILTAGVNYYIYPRHLKLTTDLGYAFSAIGENWADTTDGWRSTDESGEWVARAQLQLVI